MKTLNYDEISSQLADWASICSSSEIHGLVSGLASVGLASDYAMVEKIILRHVDENSCSGFVEQAVEAIHGAVLEQLDDVEFSFETLIPDDDEELHSRVEALSEWCQGFLVGFGTGVKTDEGRFSQEAQELLRDLVEISQVGQERSEEPSEEDEVALTELEEYVRTAVMMLYSEFVLSKEVQDKTEPSPETLH